MSDIPQNVINDIHRQMNSNSINADNISKSQANADIYPPFAVEDINKVLKVITDGAGGTKLSWEVEAP